MAIVNNFQEFQKEYKKRLRKEAIKQKVNEVKDFVIENKEIIAAAPVLISVLGKGVKAINRKIDLKKQQDLKNLYIYDMSLKAYLKYKRKPKAEELLQISKRKQNGEKLPEILDSMGLLAK